MWKILRVVHSVKGSWSLRLRSRFGGKRVKYEMFPGPEAELRYMPAINLRTQESLPIRCILKETVGTPAPAKIEGQAST